MDTNVLKFIELCQWDSARFLIVSGNVFGWLVYYSHLLPLVVSLFFAFFVFIKNSKLLATRWLLFTTILLSIWLFSDLVLWATEKPQYTMFFWSLLVLIEPIIYVGMLFFAYAIIDGKDISFGKKLIIFGLLMPTVLLLSTRFALVQYDLSNCNREAIEGPLAFYGYAIEILFSLWILGFGLKRFFEQKSIEERKKIALIIFGIVFFLLSFAMGNIIGSLFVDWVIGQYGLFGIPVFVALLAYLIVRYKTFNIKLIATQALVVALWITLFAVLFVRTIENVRIIVSLTLVLFLMIGILLVRSVLKEVRQREKMEQMAKEIQRAYEVEKEAKKKIEELGGAKTQFMLATQHHFRTPLTSINGYIDLILTGAYGKVSSKLKETVLKIKISTNRLIRVVGEVLDITQFQMGKKPIFNLLKTKIEPVVEEVLEELQFTARSKNIYLKLEKPKTEIPLVSIDVEKMKVALFNIIDNGIKYTNQGGVTVKLEVKDNKLRIMSKDTGIGITPEEMETLFVDIFERGEEAKKLFGTGQGIGLYVANQIIKGHGGRVWVESEGRGKGSIFYIELPVK